MRILTLATEAVKNTGIFLQMARRSISPRLMSGTSARMALLLASITPMLNRHTAEGSRMLGLSNAIFKARGIEKGGRESRHMLRCDSQRCTRVVTRGCRKKKSGLL